MASIRKTKPMRVAIFASGSGTNLQAVVDGCNDDDAVRVVLACSDRENTGALRRAAAAAIATHVFPDHHNADELLSVLEHHAIDLVVLAGYLRKVPAAVVDAFDGRMINIHPALLPSFGGKGMYGEHVHRAVIDGGSTVTGVTVHLVNNEYDRGQILAQWPVPVHADDSPASLAARVLAVEHRLLPAVVRFIARGGARRLPFEFDAFQAGDRAVMPEVTDDS